MKFRVSVPIEASKEDIWRVMTDFEHEQETLHNVDDVEIIEKPNTSLNGFKWRETRTLFGTEETEEISVTEFRENSYYKTHSESHGMSHDSTYSIEPEGDHNLLMVNYTSRPEHLSTRLRSMLFGSLMKTTTRRELLDDLEDIKRKVERH
ncbi:MAG: SRPBCC family protein [Clostridia bacterium]|nr:SRPBCC family protein [Clostridia bacterium]